MTEQMSSRKHIFTGIAWKTRVLLGLMVLIPIVFVSFRLAELAEEAVKTSIRRDQREIAKRAAEEIKFYLKGPLRTLKATASWMGVLDADPWRQETVLVELSLNDPVFSNLRSFDAEGNRLATSDPGAARKKKSDTRAVRKAVSGRVYVSPVRLSKDHLPFMEIAVPVYYHGKVSGELLADINLRGMWDIIDGIKIGKTGGAYLISDTGLLLAHEDKKLVLKNKNELSEILVNARFASETVTFDSESPVGNEWLASFAPIRIDGLINWGVVVYQSKKEVYSFLQKMLLESWITGAVALILSLFLSAIISGRLVRPINMLVDWSRGIGRGDFSKRAHSKRHDEIGELVESFNGMSEKLEEAREKESFVAIGVASANIAHKFKNALVSLKTFSQLIPKRKDDKDFLNKLSVSLPGEVSNLEKMLHDLSHLTQVRALNFESIDLRALIFELLCAHEEEIKNSGVQVYVDSEKKIPQVKGDREQLKQVFLNLALNAVQSMPEGGELHFDFSVLKDKLRVDVRDTGPGISEENVTKIFKPFFSTKKRGMGLGLALTKKIIEEYHKGRISIITAPGKGTTFHVILPLHRK